MQRTMLRGLDGAPSNAGRTRVAAPRRPSATLRRGVHAIEPRARRLAEKLDPRALDARVVARRLDELEERIDVLLEALAQRRIRELVTCECLGGHREREHVGEHANAQVLEWHPQDPEAAVASR